MGDDDLIRRGDAFAVVKGLSFLEGDILALPAVTDPKMKPPFYFDRYINGVRMAEDVCVERETTLESAMLVAARIAPKGPNGEVPVLVYRTPVTVPDLSDPVVVHLNMLRGTIAKPTVEQIIHLYGVEDEPVVNEKLRTMYQKYLQAIAEGRLVTDAVSPTDARLRKGD